MKRALTSAIAVLMSALTLTACSSSDGFSDSEKISAKYPRSKDISVTYNYADGALEPPGSYNDFANSAGEFSLKLFRAYGSGKESFAFSPASTVLQLSMLCNAASPEVRSDITNALGGTLSTDELNACCSYFKSRMDRDTGLSFFEFSYMLLQAYDFYVMARDFDLKAQFGGNDQWSNIIAGVDLTRKACGKEVFGLTVSLLTTSEGKKMGKTAKGALWLDERKCPVYDFFQYWRNVADADVNKCLRMLTFLPMSEVNRLSALEGSAINEAKEILAYEVTKLVHGEEKAKQALETSRQIFAGGGVSDDMPSVEMEKAKFEGEGMGLAALLKEAGLEPSTSEAYRTIQGGGARINGEQITDKKFAVTLDCFKDGELVLQKGKKKFKKIVLA